MVLVFFGFQREQNEVFSKPISANLVIDIEDEEDNSR